MANKGTNTIETYLNGIQKYKLLTTKEEDILAQRVAEGDTKAIKTLTEHNLRLVVCIAKKFVGSGVELEELIQEGNIGLIKAAQRFTYNKGAKFSTYASWWIKAEIIEYINKNKKNANNGAQDDYIDALIRQCENANVDFEEKLQQTSKQSIEVLMDCLHEREKKIITLFYGLGGTKAMSLTEIKHETNLTTERIRQIKDTAITKLRCNALAIGSSEFL